jgi:membrane fusion protein (multidrug efflux system)
MLQFCANACGKTSLKGFDMTSIYQKSIKILCLFMIFSLFSCQKNTQDQPQDQSQDQNKSKKWSKKDPDSKKDTAIPVESIRPQSKDMHFWLVQNALIEGKAHASIKALNGGLIQSLSVEEGDLVKKGQVLSSIFQPGTKDLLQKAKISLEKAKHDETRLKAMHQKGIATQDEWQQAQFQLKLAQLEYQRISQEVAVQLIKSPIEGVIAQKNIQLGESVSLGQALFEVIDLKELLIPIKIPEKWAALLAVGQTTHLLDRDSKLLYEKAKIDRVSPMIDSATGTIKVEVRLKQNEVSSLKIGMYVKVKILLGTHENVNVIPKEVIVYRGNQTFVVKNDQNTAKYIPVEIGYEEDGFVEILSNTQIDQNTKLIRFGQQGLEEGALLKDTL